MTVLVLSLAASRADADLYTPPDPGATGGITGTVAPAAAKVQLVIAIEPYALEVYRADYDDRSRRFTFRGLPPGEYDLLIKTVGHLYEGLTLEIDEGDPVTGDALEALCREARGFIFETEDYFDRKRIVRFAGTATHARALVVQTRTLHVVDPGGTKIDAWIRRVDLVDLVKTRKVWQIPTSRHLLRQEVPYRAKDARIEFTHSPKLAGLLVGERVVDLGIVALNRLPRTPRGRYPTASYDARRRSGGS